MSDSFDILTVQEFLLKYNNWNSSIQRTADGESFLYCPFVGSNDAVVFLLLKIEGDFLTVSTIDFLKIDKKDTYEHIARLNDKLKLVKAFLPANQKEFIEIGFEIIKEVFSYDLFETYMDMIAVTLESLLADISQVKHVSINHLKHLDTEGKIV